MIIETLSIGITANGKLQTTEKVLNHISHARETHLFLLIKEKDNKSERGSCPLRRLEFAALTGCGIKAFFTDSLLK